MNISSIVMELTFPLGSKIVVVDQSNPSRNLFSILYLLLELLDKNIFQGIEEIFKSIVHE